MQDYEETVKQSRNLAEKMRSGSGAASLLKAEDCPTHHMDSLERFKKDFAFFEKNRRESERQVRQYELERKRNDQLERQNRRWQEVDRYNGKLKEREEFGVLNQKLGIKRIHNTGSLPYNPINLSYDEGIEGQRLKRRDQDSKIRGYVRAHNMDFRGNSKFNPINGEYRVGIEKVIPEELENRFENKLSQHYEHFKLKAPTKMDEYRANSYDNKYY